MAAEFQKKSFTIKWRIENYNLLSDCDEFWSFSPSLTVDILEKTKFRLSVLPSIIQNTVCVAFVDDNNCILPTNKKLAYHFSISPDHGSSSQIEKSIENHENILFFDIPKSEIYKREGNKFLLPDILTFQCKIWSQQGLLPENGECLLITEPQMERLSFVGVVENFSSLKCGEKKAILIRSVSDEDTLFSMNIGLTKKRETFIEILLLNDKKIRFCKCVFYLLDNAGNETKCGKSKFIVPNPLSVWRIPFQSKIDPMELDKKYLPKNCLSLQFEMTYYTAEFRKKFVKTKYATILSSNIEQSTFDIKNKTEVVREDNQLMFTVQDDLISLLASGMLSDTKLTTATETFHAHKNILSARSPVFKAMFTSNMKEKINDSVEIEDIDAETVRRFLKFLYSDYLQDLDFENAKKLYFAGDKYEVLTLKNKCSRYLQENLCPSNCCDVLVLADRHSDSDLKQVVQEYFAHHDKEIYKTDQWKHLEDTNPVLTLDTLRVMYEKYQRNS